MTSTREAGPIKRLHRLAQIARRVIAICEYFMEGLWQKPAYRHRFSWFHLMGNSRHVLEIVSFYFTHSRHIRVRQPRWLYSQR
jgi:hypothetical protein